MVRERSQNCSGSKWIVKKPLTETKNETGISKNVGARKRRSSCRGWCADGKGWVGGRRKTRNRLVWETMVVDVFTTQFMQEEAILVPVIMMPAFLLQWIADCEEFVKGTDAKEHFTKNRIFEVSLLQNM